MTDKGVVGADDHDAAAPSSLTTISRRVVFVGGLPDEATITMVRAAFIPFGDITSVDMPMDYVNNRHRGFAFVEFEETDDAEEAIFNMDGAELMGRTVHVNVAQPNQVHKLTSATASSNTEEAIWKSDEWFQKQIGIDKDELEKQKIQASDAQTLQET